MLSVEAAAMVGREREIEMIKGWGFEGRFQASLLKVALRCTSRRIIVSR